MSYTPMDTISQNLLFITDAPTNAQFEVTVSDMAYGRPVAVDTVAAQFDRKIPWEYASANLLNSTFGPAPLEATAARLMAGRRRDDSAFPMAQLHPGTSPATSADRRRNPGRE